MTINVESLRQVSRDFAAHFLMAGIDPMLTWANKALHIIQRPDCRFCKAEREKAHRENLPTVR